MIDGRSEALRRRRGIRPPAFQPGRQALVDHGLARLHGHEVVPLTDESGVEASRELLDGQAVEMLAWRLVWRQGPSMLYHVRCLPDGVRGWVRAEFLRPLPAAAAPPRVARQLGGMGGRRSEQRRVGHATPETVTTGDAAPPQRPAHQGERAVLCAVCGIEVHPYNLWKNPRGQVIGCGSCQGKRR